MSKNPEQKPLDAGDWFPWRMFVAAAGVACDPRVLLLAVVGLFFSHVGETAWWNSEWETVAVELPEEEISFAVVDLINASVDAMQSYLAGFESYPIGKWQGWLTTPWGWMALCVWTAVGAAIARIAALRLTHHEVGSFRKAIDAAWETTLPRIGVVLGLGLIHTLMWGVVWLLGTAASSPTFGGLVDFFLPLVLLFAALPALLGLCIAVGWPLMTAAAGVERPDAFDLVSRGIAYAYQRPLRLVVYLAQAWVVGVVGGGVAHLLARSVMRVASVWLETRGGELTGMAAVWWWAGEHLPMVYHAAYFWSAAVVIYLLLRRDIDEQQADEIFLEAADVDQAAGE